MDGRLDPNFWHGFRNWHREVVRRPADVELTVTQLNERRRSPAVNVQTDLLFTPVDIP
jgi:hypothetical protein